MYRICLPVAANAPLKTNIIINLQQNKNLKLKRNTTNVSATSSCVFCALHLLLLQLFSLLSVYVNTVLNVRNGLVTIALFVQVCTCIIFMYRYHRFRCRRCRCFFLLDNLGSYSTSTLLISIVNVIEYTTYLRFIAAAVAASTDDGSPKISQIIK